MPLRAFLLYPVILSTLLVAACTSAEKSENPLSPSVAGPIPGVHISPPSPLEPRDGKKIEFAEQPIRLLLANAETNGVRPLTYLFEVAADAGFVNKVFVREGISPGENGKTGLALPDGLATGRTYYWRAKARDGANEGAYSALAFFNVFTPIVINRPVPRVPVNDVLLDSAFPTFTIGNAPRSGPVGPLTYSIEIADSDSFASKYVVWTVGEQPNQTTFEAPSGLPAGKRLFWHARASDPTTFGPWSETQVFRTPELAPAPGGGGGGNGTGGHLPAGPLSEDRARQVIFGTFDEFPGLSVVFGSNAAAEDAAEQLLLRTIWHLHLAGYNAARQRNPSGAISKDKLTIFIGGRWHNYDIYSLGVAGRATTVQFYEIGSPNPVPHPGIPD